MDFAYCGMGFFGRGFFVSSLIYINEIGGDKFRAWATIVVFGIWGLSPLLESLEKIFNVPGWLWVYLCVLVPFFIGSFFVLSYWKPSPFHLATKSTRRLRQDNSRKPRKCLMRWHLKTTVPFSRTVSKAR